MAEDAASVLEQFIQDMANLPAEIAHLLEEIQAKDRIVEECRNTITARDGSIQKYHKANGASSSYPKEEAYVSNIMASYEKAETVQQEKIALAERSTHLLDRQIRRLDVKIRDLQNEGAISIDPELPSLLKTSTLSTRLPPLSTSTAGVSAPLHPLSGNAGPSTTVATGNPSTRLTHPPRSISNRHPSPSPLSVSTIPSHLNTSAAVGSSLSATTPITSSLLNPRVATRSPSSDPSKRRRLNPHHLLIPPTSSTLRQSSLGPGTPKSLHPLSNSRSGSAGPRLPKKPLRTNPPHHQRIGHLNPSSVGAPANKKPYRRRTGKKSTPGGGVGQLKPSPSDTGEESAISEGDGHEGESDVEMDDAEGEGDDRKYCTCRSVSYGNMVACDNDDCPYEWFHWSCVGMTKEPAGTWFCDECRGKMKAFL